MASGIAFAQACVDITISENTIIRAGASGINGAILERNGNYLGLWTLPQFDDGRSLPYVALHNIVVTGNRIVSPTESAVLIQGVSARWIDIIAVSRNRIIRPNAGGSASRVGIGVNYADVVEIAGNYVGDAPTTAVTKYSTSNTRNLVLLNNLPIGAVTQSAYIGDKLHSSGAVPSAGTWNLGDTRWNANPQGATVAFWMCKTAGTFGTLNSGNTTGSVNAGSAALTVSSAAGLTGGEYITIAGVAGRKRVVTVQGTTVTLDSAADATVSGAAVAFAAPAFSNGPNLS